MKDDEFHTTRGNCLPNGLIHLSQVEELLEPGHSVQSRHVDEQVQLDLCSFIYQQFDQLMSQR